MRRFGCVWAHRKEEALQGSWKHRPYDRRFGHRPRENRSGVFVDENFLPFADQEEVPAGLRSPVSARSGDVSNPQSLTNQFN
jgi:hypothetical protein